MKTVPDSVKSIGSGVFFGCTSLTSITIGSGVRSIIGYAFSGCPALVTVYYKGTAEDWKKSGLVLIIILQMQRGTITVKASRREAEIIGTT